jgi:iron complex outermembrane receptor protein
MKLNSPMLGMVDFSLIPSYFIDYASLYHGASSVSVASGGLGGAITLNTKPAGNNGISLRYIQGISSYNTNDQFLIFTCSSGKIQSSTRVAYTISDNNFKYKNYHKKTYFKDDNGNITGFEYPVERNKNGNFRDFHALQEFYYTSSDGSNFGLSAWYINSRRGVPMLNVDYHDESKSRSQQDEQDLRIVASWNKSLNRIKLYGNAGYAYSNLRYIYLGDKGSDIMSEMIHSQSYVNTGFAKFDAEYYIGKKWMLAMNCTAYQHFVNSRDNAVINTEGKSVIIGYIKSRFELSAFANVKYRPIDKLGISLNIREDLYGLKKTPLIPAVFVNYMISEHGNISAKASVARNYRYPTLNDLYFMPSGNDSLKNELGYTYDGGIEFSIKQEQVNLNGEITFFNSNIRDWIVWLPNVKGFWTPSNIKKVNSYGTEIKFNTDISFNKEWKFTGTGNFTWTRAINRGEPVNWADESIGKQLVYIPEFSAAATGKLVWKSWTFMYKWTYYSERFTTSSNEKHTKIGQLGKYFMNDISLEKQIAFSWANIAFKILVNNIFDEEYESVLSHPMAGRNFGFFIEINPKIRKK